MFGLGSWEVLLVLVVILLIFGPKQLPKIGRSLGGFISGMRDAGRELQKTIEGDDE